MNRTRQEILFNILKASAGLVVFGLGIYLVLLADIGARPWDVLCVGLSKTLKMRYGDVAFPLSIVIIILSRLLGEPIAIGMFLDAVIVGKTVDLLNYLHPISQPSNLIGAVVMVFLGLLCLGLSVMFYTTAALGCGPRVSLLIGLSKKLPKVSIGVVSAILLGVVTLLGWMLGGSVGLGTILSILFEGAVMDFVFWAFHFDAKSFTHQDLLTSLRVIVKGKSE